MSRYFEPDGIGTFELPDENDLASSYENYEAINGDYNVQIFNHKPIPVSYSLMKNSYDIDGNINQMNEYFGVIDPGKVITYKLSHSTEPYIEENNRLLIDRALFLDSRRKHKAFINGKIILENKKLIPNLSKAVKINIAQFEKTIPLSKFSKFKLDKNNVIYTYADWGKKDVVLQINTKTGEFLLYFDNINLDDTRPTLKTNLKIIFDNIVAQASVTFKNIPKGHHGRK